MCSQRRLELYAFHLRKYKNILLVWVITGACFAVIKFLIGKYNNYKIFKYVYYHAIDGFSLYKEYPDQYGDNNHYGVLFGIIIAPFAMLPDISGIILWVVVNTVILFYAIRQLPLTHTQKAIVYWFSYCELMTAQSMQQFNISIAAFIILSFTLIEKKKDFWAACVIVLGAFVKIYPIVGLAFFFFSRHKIRFILSCVFWGLLFLFIPVLYTPGYEYMISQYKEWFTALQSKNIKNMFAISQNISLLGVVRKLSGNPYYSDLWLIIPGLFLFFLPYLRISQYKNLRFRLMLLANVLLFTVLFSTGSEGSGYIIAMIGVAIWYVCSPSKSKRYKKWLFIATLVIVGLSTTELVPPYIRREIVWPYVTKAWPCILVWLTICREMIFLDFRVMAHSGNYGRSG
jgi:hypothetical protein